MIDIEFLVVLATMIGLSLLAMVIAAISAVQLGAADASRLERLREEKQGEDSTP